MSQIYKASTGGGGGGALNTLTPDSGGIVSPTANNINILGQTSVDNNLITTNIGASTITVSHYYKAGTTTIDDAPNAILSIALTVASVINISCQIAGIESTPLGVGGEIRATAFRGGAGATLLGVPDTVVRSSVPLAAARFQASILGTQLLIEVVGVPGRTIEWYAIADVVQKTFI